MDRKLLSIYLTDHDALAVGSLELARRAAGAHKGTPFGDCVAELAEQLGSHHEELRSVMAALEVKPDPIKTRVAWAGEKLGRLKLNGRIVESSPLSPVVEAEGLLALLQAWAATWGALATLPDGTLPAGVDPAGRALECTAAADEVERHRLDLVRSAFAAG